MGKKQNNKKRKKQGGGKGSCLGGKRSFSANGRAAKRARKIAKNIAKSQGAHMAELEHKLKLERALGTSADWTTSGVSQRQQNRLKRYRKEHGFASVQTSDQMLPHTLNSTSSNIMKNSSETAQNLPEFCTWNGIVPASAEQPSIELKLQRKNLGIRVKGHPCPAPLDSASDPRLPSSTFTAHWNFGRPTPVQQQLWPAALCALDCVAVAPTGSGKTLAYFLPGIAHVKHKLDGRSHQSSSRKAGATQKITAARPHMLVCVPTRELAQQVIKVGESQLKLNRAGMRCVSLVGGRGNKSEQVDELLRSGDVDVLVGTCGRILDMIELGALSVDRVTYLVLDEADMMLQMGFEEQLCRLIAAAPTSRQSILVSATFPQRLRDAVARWTRPSALVIIRVNVTTERSLPTPRNQADSLGELSSAASSLSAPTTNSNSVLAASQTIVQRIQVLPSAPMDDQLIFQEKLRRLIGFLDRINAHDAKQGRRQASAVLVFANTRDAVSTIHKYLRKRAGVKNRNRTKGGRQESKASAVGFGCAMLHGQLPQARRADSLIAFKSGKCSILVTTDVAARGLDVKALSFVFNFDMPQSIETYVHRIGRTGRNGRSGVAETLFLPSKDKALTVQLRRLLEACNQVVPETM